MAYIVIVIFAILTLSFFLPRFLKSRTGAEGLLRESQALFEAKNYAKALEKSREILEKYPDFDKIDAAILSVGFAQSGLGNYDQALLTFEKLIADYPESKYTPDALYYAAEIYSKKNDLRKTAEYLDRIFKDYPDDQILAQAGRLKIKLTARQAFFKADSFFDQKKYQEALAEHQRLFNNYSSGLEPEFRVAALFQMGYSQEQLGNDDEALLTFQNLINDYPGDVFTFEALHLSAQIYIKKNDFQKAEEYYDKILKDYPRIMLTEQKVEMEALKTKIDAEKYK